MTCRTIIFGISRLSQISHTIFWRTEGLGEGCVKKRTVIVSCLEWLTSYFYSLMMVEFKKVPYSGDLKMVLIFLVTKVFQKNIMFKLVNV